MEVALIGKTSIRLKGKSTILLIDPEKKLEADAALILENSASGIDGDYQLLISGPGEYETKGTKITGVKAGESTNYYLSLDTVNLLIAKASSLKGKENLKDVDMALILSDILVDQSALATVADSVSIFYGNLAEENIKKLGKDQQAVNKYSITKEKLPSEMEVVWLA